MITQQMEREDIPGRGALVEKDTEVGTQGCPGSPGWLEYGLGAGRGGDLPGDSLDQDVKPPASHRGD